MRIVREKHILLWSQCIFLISQEMKTNKVYEDTFDSLEEERLIKNAL